MILRLVGWLFALISFSCAGSIPWVGSAPFSSFFVFVGVMAFLFDMFFLATYVVGERLPAPVTSKVRTFVPFVPSFFFFFALFSKQTNLPHLSRAAPHR